MVLPESERRGPVAQWVWHSAAETVGWSLSREAAEHRLSVQTCAPPLAIDPKDSGGTNMAPPIDAAPRRHPRCTLVPPILLVNKRPVVCYAAQMHVNARFRVWVADRGCRPRALLVHFQKYIQHSALQTFVWSGHSVLWFYANYLPPHTLTLRDYAFHRTLFFGGNLAGKILNTVIYCLDYTVIFIHSSRSTPAHNHVYSWLFVDVYNIILDVKG